MSPADKKAAVPRERRPEVKTQSDGDQAPPEVLALFALKAERKLAAM